MKFGGTYEKTTPEFIFRIVAATFSVQALADCTALKKGRYISDNDRIEVTVENTDKGILLGEIKEHTQTGIFNAIFFGRCSIDQFAINWENGSFYGLLEGDVAATPIIKNVHGIIREEAISRYTLTYVGDAKKK